MKTIGESNLYVSGLIWLFKVFADVNKIWWCRLPYIAGLASITVYRVSVGSFDISLFEFYPTSRQVSLKIFLHSLMSNFQRRL